MMTTLQVWAFVSPWLEYYIHPGDVFGEGGTLAPGLEGTITVGLDGKSSGASSPITHLWLDGNPLEYLRQVSSMDFLNHGSAAPTVEEISLSTAK